mmetsp:Transcript_8265/g.17044  ORF Transcript_8265/g.17044 Transcript_8265/m.17044 type:complete len:221 (+) Transcript_8265:783-1445(+)
MLSWGLPRAVGRPILLPRAGDRRRIPPLAPIHTAAVDHVAGGAPHNSSAEEAGHRSPSAVRRGSGNASKRGDGGIKGAGRAASVRRDLRGGGDRASGRRDVEIHPHPQSLLAGGSDHVPGRRRRDPARVLAVPGAVPAPPRLQPRLHGLPRAAHLHRDEEERGGGDDAVGAQRGREVPAQPGPLRRRAHHAAHAPLLRDLDQRHAQGGHRGVPHPERAGD